MRLFHFVLAGLLGLAPAGLRADPAPRTWRAVSEWYTDSLRDLNTFAANTQQSELRFKVGDDPAWASPAFDDSAWAVADRNNVLRKNAGVFWVRFRTRAKDPGQPLPTGVFVVETAASEIFWDGVLVRRCGEPGPDRAHEIPGQVYSLFDLPGSAVGPGEHVVALRMSTYWFNRPDPTMNLFISSVESSNTAHMMLREMLIPMLGVGALALFGLAAITFWATAGRPRGVLLFAGLNLGGAITLFAIHVRHIFPVPYSWSYPVWTATEILVAITSACLVALVLVQFDLPRRRWLAGAFVALLVADGIRQALVYHMIEPVKVMVESWRAAFLVSSALLIWALVRRRTGAAYVLVATVVAGLWYEHDPEEFLSENFLLTMLPILLGFILVIGLDLSAERRQAREARLTAARLELELLRKSLQPHFLMNTLTAVSQAMEENHHSAARLIDDLAAELRELAQFAEHKEVPLDRELDLCRAHLRIMSVRTEKPWRLETEGIDPGAMVPPALFFTLIENGFTHQQPIAGATAFRLRSETVDGGRRHVFFSPGKVRTSPPRPAGGSGLRYVKARLNECWPGGWRFDHGPVDGGWETRVELRAGPGRSAP
jgi:hypothetical protein